MPPRFRPVLEPFEPRLTPAFPIGSADVTFVPAGGGLLRAIDPLTGIDVGDLTPFPDAFAGEVRSATADLNFDGVPELIAAAGPGGAPRVRVFNGRTGDVIADFLAFEPEFHGGVYVAVADVNGDSRDEIIVGAGEGGGPRVRVFAAGMIGYADAPSAPSAIADFLAFEPEFRGGVRVAGGNVDFSPADDVIVAAGPGGAPWVRVYTAGDRGVGLDGLREAYSFLAYDPGLRTGVYVTTTGEESQFVGNRLVQGGAEVVTSPGAGGAPHVKVFTGATGAEEASFLLGDPAGRAGLRVTATRYGLLGETPTPAGPTLLLGPLTRGEVYWSLPPGAVRVTGPVKAVAPDAGTLTLTTDAGLRVITVRSDAPVRRARTWELIPLRDVTTADGAILRLGTDGTAVEVLIVSPITAPPPPQPGSSTAPGPVF